MKKQLLLLGFLGYALGINAQCFSDISSGNYFNFGIKPNGTLWGWGSNMAAGQLGDGTQTDKWTPTQITATADWQKVVCGPYDTFAIKTNGTLWCTGDNSTGQLGIGSTVSYLNTFTQMGTDTNWTQVSASNGFTIALKTNGTLWGWGQNDSYQMGDGTCCSNRLSPGQIGTDTDWSLIQTSGTIRTGLALKSNGTLWGWGGNSTGLVGPSNVGSRQYPTQLRPETDWATISAGNGHALALKTNGTLWGWGAGNYGQAGDPFPTIYFRDTPVQVGTNTNWVYIGTGHSTSYGIQSDGTLWGWGRNDTGQVGDGTTTNRTQPVQIGTDTDWVRVTGGWFHGMAQKANGAIYTWGSNDFGQLGNGGTTAVSLPTAITVPGCTLGTEDFEEVKMVISPNPVGETLQFAYRGNAVVDGLKIYDMTGKVVYSSNPVASSQLQATLPLVLPKGIYLLVLHASGKVVVSEKFVKE
ncbi:T9SS type A sorting domain-containing protein [Flavobacterium sedimenticola]|uniref:T9SS type A sorting domain-containing protein n=1 Tax=Flavobacterium sedimenticola TaxID=3043286 RepID=A0ABT6XTY3_9FLAO|nr:T9SS type A sorting domain-containing protein [Flavobacterium sedimenticola]MDI9258545.1 T9SS type A sorting domain-containing protein [Flavobacterium sedimenticola]